MTNREYMDMIDAQWAKHEHEKDLNDQIRREENAKQAQEDREEEWGEQDGELPDRS